MTRDDEIGVESYGAQKKREREEALAALVDAYDMIWRAKQLYTNQLYRCVELGMSKNLLGKHLGLSETAVRHWMSRWKYRDNV